MGENRDFCCSVVARELICSFIPRDSHNHRFRTNYVRTIRSLHNCHCIVILRGRTAALFPLFTAGRAWTAGMVRLNAGPALHDGELRGGTVGAALVRVSPQAGAALVRKKREARGVPRVDRGKAPGGVHRSRGVRVMRHGPFPRPVARGAAVVTLSTERPAPHPAGEQGVKSTVNDRRDPERQREGTRN